MSFGMRTFYFSEVTFMPNAKVLESKKTIVDALSEKIQNSTSAVFVDYKGITVAQDTELRVNLCNPQEYLLVHSEIFL